ncbi:MAG: hypothetical protein ACOYN0_08080 [Phycisphaerales bacterium]
MDRRTRTEQIAAFPEPMRLLIEAELRAGNEIIAMDGTHPAPPAGLCARLAKHVTTRPRESFDGIRFFERNSSDYSGEFADAARMYFIVEPPREQGPPPDMDAIRGVVEAAERYENCRMDNHDW